jgi:imidazolonepropionase-like amidohydrolase
MKLDRRIKMKKYAKLLGCMVLSLGLVVSAMAQEAQPVSKVLITNASIFDGKSDKLTEPMSVLVEGNKISRIANSIPAPSDATVIDGGDKVLMPGLMDMHVHLTWNMGMGEYMDSPADYIAALALFEAENTLMRGITTVRDTGGQVMGIRRAIDLGYHVGPRIYAAGATISMTSGHTDFRLRNIFPRQLGGPAVTEVEMLRGTVIADGVPEVLTASREQFRQGADFLKVIVGGAVSGLRDPLDVAEYSDEEIEAAVGEAIRWNTYAAVHGYTDRAIQSALKAGAMSIEHAHLATEETVKMIAEKGAFLSTQTGFYLGATPDSFSSAQKARQQQAAEGMDLLMRLAKKHKVKMVSGTDFVGTFETKATQLSELTNRLKWFTPVEILRQATSISGELAALSGPRNPYPGKLGVVEAGALADLLLVDGNPLKDLSILTKPEENLALIMKDGKIYKNTLD